MRRCYSLVGLLDLKQFSFFLDALGTRVLVCASLRVSLCRLQRRHRQVAQTFHPRDLHFPLQHWLSLRGFNVIHYLHDVLQGFAKSHFFFTFRQVRFQRQGKAPCVCVSICSARRRCPAGLCAFAMVGRRCVVGVGDGGGSARPGEHEV